MQMHLIKTTILKKGGWTKGSKRGRSGTGKPREDDESLNYGRNDGMTVEPDQQTKRMRTEATIIFAICLHNLSITAKFNNFNLQ